MIKRSVRVGMVGLVALAGVVIPALPAGSASSTTSARTVVVPLEDRFTPFAVTVSAGQSVQWVNLDTDNHTVVSDDAYSTTNNRGTDRLLTGTVAGGGQPGRVTLTFDRPGTFVYYCRFHAHLDKFAQPVSPGPDGGIAGTPMMGIVTVR